jgi:hypothetical protein
MDEYWAKLRRRILENTDAPVDQLVRKLFELGAAEVSETEEGEKFGSSQELLEHWYNVDEVRLNFRIGERRGMLYLVHQSHLPHFEDVTNYSTWLEELPEMRKLLRGEGGTYRLIYTE